MCDVYSNRKDYWNKRGYIHSYINISRWYRNHEGEKQYMDSSRCSGGVAGNPDIIKSNERMTEGGIVGEGERCTILFTLHGKVFPTTVRSLSHV